MRQNLVIKLSDLNKQQAQLLKVKWVELRNKNGYKRFGKILQELKIPHIEFNGDIDISLDKILNELIY